MGVSSTGVRLGIRLQLLLALGSLLVLAFVPLFFAVASLTRATMGQVRESNARALGRAIAGHVTEARATRGDDGLLPLLEAQLGEDGVAAIGVYDSAGRLIVHAGEGAAAEALPASMALNAEEVRPVQTARGGALLIVVPDQANAAGGARRGAVAALLRTDPSTVPSAPLVRLVALYTGVVALALLVFAYISMTRLVVRPVVELSDAARRVADGARRLEVPASGGRELMELAESLQLMTERLRADEEALRGKIAEIERATAELKSAQERLVRSERLASVGRLAAGLAHEIGNPIAAILGFQELLLEGGLDPREERDFLERMKRETERVHHVLRDMLDFARPQSLAPSSAGGAGAPGAAIPHAAGIVSESIADVVALMAPQKSWKGVALVQEVAPDLPPVALAHAQLVQVLLNLLLNAADAVPGEGGRVTIRAMIAERIGDSPRGAAERGVRIEVEDNGPGIAPEIQGRLFEPFATTKEVGKGTGLGLAVCRGLLEAVGGTITAERGEQGGARFVLELPAAVAP